MGFRVDRFATLYLVHPIRRRAFPIQASIPILMYHSISSENEQGIGAYYRTGTAPSVFAAHMNYLHEHEYTTISLTEAASLLEQGGATERRAVVTFDDGYADFHRYAFPTLGQHGFTATMFLPTGYISSSPQQFKGKDCLTWSQVRELRRNKVSFGSHTVTHPQLSKLPSEKVVREIGDSKRAIEDEIGESIDSFAYPFAFPQHNTSFVRQLRDVLVEHGYRQGVCTRIGMARPHEDRYFLRRLPMNSLDDSSLFVAKLNGGYDWLHTVQHVSKRIRANAR